MRTLEEWSAKYGPEESDWSACICCKFSAYVDDAESTKDGLICADCMRESVACVNCGVALERREYVTADGISRYCSECSYAKDMAERMAH